MRCEETNVAMCLESHKYDICGLQFHLLVFDPKWQTIYSKNHSI